MNLDATARYIVALAVGAVLLFDAAARAQEKPAEETAKAEQVSKDEPKSEPAPEAGSEAGSEAGAEAGAEAATVADDEQAEPAAAPSKPDLPASTHFGELLAAGKSDAAVQWVNLEKVLLAQEFEPGLAVDDAAIDSRAPGDGKSYGVLAVRVQQGRSLGKHDYVLRLDGQTSPCLALRVGAGPFDVRRWIVRPEGAAEDAAMLFELPADAEGASLELALSTTVPQASVAFSFGVELSESSTEELLAPETEKPAGDPAAPESKEGKTSGSDDSGLAALMAGDEKAEATPGKKPEPVPGEAPEEPAAKEEVAKPAPAPKKEAPKKAGADEWF